MLNKRSFDLSEMVWSAALRLGTRSAPRIADDILSKAYPRTVEEAEVEGAVTALRRGFIADVERIVRSAAGDDTQIDIGDIDPAFQTIARKLKSNSYYVETRQQQETVSSLVSTPAWLDDARKHMRRKGEECLAEATTLDELYAAVTAPAPQPGEVAS